MELKQILKSLVAVALAVLIASNTASGIYYDSVEALIASIVLLSIFNSFLKPLLLLFSLPFIILTFGFGILIINALLFLLVAAIVNGFHVETFISALWGALIVSVINLIVTIYFGGAQNARINVKINRSGRFSNGASRLQREDASRRVKSFKQDDDVIDI